VSERCACRAIGQQRSTQRHRPRSVLAPEEALRTRLRELSSLHPRWGYRLIHGRLRLEGWAVNRKRVQRLWRDEGLRVPQRQPKRNRVGISTVPALRLRAERPNHVWAMDFLFDTTVDGRPFKVLSMCDEFTRESIGGELGRSITAEDVTRILGFMAVLHGMDATRSLTLVLHTPGGVTNAAESLVAYLRSKFTDIEVIVPAFAMSAGTMISLAANRIVMGRQSQLGPIDPQLPTGAGFVSARAVIEQFERAKTEILDNVVTAHVWAPILPSLGPSLLQESQNALDYGQAMVARWLTANMFRGRADAEELGNRAARHFNDATTHKSHGRRIDRDEARSVALDVLDLEPHQDFQDAVLTAYHLVTIAFEKSPATKMLSNSNGQHWVKNWEAVQVTMQGVLPQGIIPSK